jgi:DNA invertase Pin-like site-specific DNA recombinase
MPFEVALSELQEPPCYQKIAAEAKRLSQLGMNPNRIASYLGVHRTTVARALRRMIAEKD